MDINRRFHVSASYFMLFFCIGSFYPFINLFLYRSGWSGVEVGLFSSIGPLVALATQPMWGVICDTMGSTKRIYTVLLVGMSLTMVVFGFVPVGSIFFLLPIMMGLLQSPLNPLLDSLAIKTLQTSRNNLGGMRMWGSLSFALISSIMGWAFSVSERSIFFAFAVGALGAVFFASRLEGDSPPKDDMVNKDRRNILREVISAPLLVFLMLAFLLQLGHGVAMNFLSIVMESRGASSSIIGYTWSITALVEIPIFLLTGKLLMRYSPVLVMAFGALITTIRLVAFIYAPSPEWMLAAQAIDGFAYPLLLIPGVLIVYELVPDRWRTTGQTLYAAIALTLSRILGGILGGRVFDLFGGVNLFFVCGVLTLTACVGLAVWNRVFVELRTKAQAVA